MAAHRSAARAAPGAADPYPAGRLQNHPIGGRPATGDAVVGPRRDGKVQARRAARRSASRILASTARLLA